MKRLGGCSVPELAKREMVRNERGEHERQWVRTLETWTHTETTGC